MVVNAQKPIRRPIFTVRDFCRRPTQTNADQSSLCELRPASKGSLAAATEAIQSATEWSKPSVQTNVVPPQGQTALRAGQDQSFMHHRGYGQGFVIRRNHLRDRSLAEPFFGGARACRA